MTGVLLIDKPEGPTSHDVVARLRRTSGERRIGHTGTLDPLATGLLALVLGRATRLTAVLTGGVKRYEAVIRLGFATSTDDREGEPIERPSGDPPGEAAVREALAAFLGAFDQMPPRHSAKKLGGRRAYELARQAAPVALKPVPVVVRDLELVAMAGDRLSVRVAAESGFYVRALARDLGERLGCGGHLAALRRTGSGPFGVGEALPLETAERLGPAIEARLIAPAAALPDLAAVSVTPAGLVRCTHGNPIGPEHLQGQWVPPATGDRPVKVLDAAGGLVALAHSRGGALHPVVVLG
jgi:tRNA pseudouridine55 synthase